MIQRGQLSVENAVAAALVRRTGDTLAARLFHERPEARSVEGLLDALGIPPAERAAIAIRAHGEARALLERGRAAGLHVVPSGSDGYPALLGHIADPPIAVWTKGTVEVLSLASVAIVGTRRPSPAGAAFATRLAADLAAAGLAVVSGMARGIDAAAHGGAVRAGGWSIAVLGSGLDVIYPPEHRNLAAELVSRGCLVSEFPPGTKPFRSNFPLRNRLISGLSLAVVVVEAAERSGSLITARMALEQGRSVCAVPGGVVSGCHRGCHALIKDGARLVETVQDVLDEIGWVRPTVAGGDGRKPHTDNELLCMMRVAEAVDLDQLAIRTGRSGPRLLAELGQLEVAGRVERTPGGYFVRLD